MLTHAVGFVLDAELACFAVILGVMAWQDRENRGLRWLALAYFAGLCGTGFDYASPGLPGWAAPGLALAAAPLGYACLYTSITEMVGRARPSRWLAAALVALALPWLLLWSQTGRWQAASTLQDAVLALLTSLSVGLLLLAAEPVTRAPRLTMAVFLTAYAAVEYGRVGVYFRTGLMPSAAMPPLELASGFVYVVSCAALPLAFIWMMNVRLHADLVRQANTDPLTGLWNRRGLETACAIALRAAHRAGQPLALALLDLDFFKRINDEMGHPAGDQALAQVAVFLTQHAREGELVGRLGGEEFVMLLPRLGRAQAKERIEFLGAELAAHALHLEGQQYRVTASAGLAVADADQGAGWSELLRQADQALYSAKRAGRNRTEVADLGSGLRQRAAAATVVATTSSE